MDYGVGPTLAGYEELFGAPSWVPGWAAGGWDRAGGALRSLSGRAQQGFSSLTASAGAAGQATLQSIQDVANQTLSQGRDRVRTETTKAKTAFREFVRVRAEFERKMEDLERTDPQRASSIRAQTYGRMAPILAAFDAATERFPEVKTYIDPELQKGIEDLRREAGSPPAQAISGDRFGIEPFTTISVILVILVLVAFMMAIKSLVREFQGGVTEANRAIYEESYGRARAEGLSHKEAHDEALNLTHDTDTETGLNINKALPWIFGIAFVAIGVPYAFKTTKEFRE